MKLYLIFLNVWIASVYYMIYCEPRSYNNALAGFWGIMAIFWIYDLKVNYTPFLVQRLRRCFPPPRNTRKNIKKSTLTGALFQIAEN